MLIFIGTCAFAFGNAGNDAESTNGDATTIDEDVEIGAGEEISPQLELEDDSAQNFDVDTVSSSATETNQER